MVFNCLCLLYSIQFHLFLCSLILSLSLIFCELCISIGCDVTAKLVSAFVLSRLDCCNAVLTGLPASTLAPLQRVLNAAAWVVVGLRPRDHVTPSLCELHWLPIAARIDYKLCLLVHKSFVGQVSDYITELLTPAAILHGHH